MRIVVNDLVYLSEIRNSDRDALVACLHDRDIYERTLRIPYPYTDKDADTWLARIAESTQQQGRLTHFAIRIADEALIGGCGFVFELGQSHRADIGYWLAKPFWGRGIMTSVVERICQHAFDEFGLSKITAHVFIDNRASARVLEKCGFVQEGVLRKHFLKEGKFLDARLFGLFKSPLPGGEGRKQAH